MDAPPCHLTESGEKPQAATGLPSPPTDLQMLQWQTKLINEGPEASKPAAPHEQRPTKVLLGNLLASETSDEKKRRDPDPPCQLPVLKVPPVSGTTRH
mmetsp:Transcript_79622/g.234162  ORF Transcript_79622/g.234162 Transcript_79622/m.234162 type:complete len:98 (-) Transcript_79622:153-446(-)